MHFRRKSPIIASRKGGAPMKYRKWDPKTKMQIVLEGLEGRTQLSELCNKYHITQSMFYYWVKELQTKGHKIFESVKESKKEQKLKEILDRRNIKLVCVQYPMCGIEPLKRIFKWQEDVIFIDNEKIFKEAVGKEDYQEYFIDMFGGDFGHCTPKGE